MEDINCLLCYKLVHVDTQQVNQKIPIKNHQNFTEIFSKFFNFSFDTFFSNFDTSFCPKCSSNVIKFGSKLTTLQKLEAQIQRLKCQFENHLISGYKLSLDLNGHCQSQRDPHFDNRCLLVQGLGLLEKMELEDQLNDNVNVDLNLTSEFNFEDQQDYDGHEHELGQKFKIQLEEINDISPPEFVDFDFEDQDQENEEFEANILNTINNDTNVATSIYKNVIISLEKLKLPSDQTSFKLSDLRNIYGLEIPSGFYGKSVKKFENTKKKRHVKFNKDLFYCTYSGCDYKTRFKHFMDSHVHYGDPNPDKGRQFACPHCEYISFRNSDLVRHERAKHTGERPYRCEDCGRGFVTSTILKTHLTTYNHDKSSKIYKCDVCFKGFRLISRLKIHQKTHKDKVKKRDPSRACHICGKVLKNQKLFDIHLKVHSVPALPVEQKKKIKFAYPHCEYTSITNFDLVQHKRAKHTGEKPFICEQCGLDFVTSSLFKNHLSTHNVTMDLQESNSIHNVEKKTKRKFSCSHCEYTSARNFDIVRHERAKHTGEKPFICETCGRCFVVLNLLKYHMSTHDESSRIYKCDMCFKGFPLLSRLKLHQETHKDRNPHTCHICSKVFKHTISFKLHMKVHSIDQKTRKKFTCPHCEYTSFRRYDIARHEKYKHNKEKPFTCEKCTRNFATSSHLKSHLSIHLMNPEKFNPVHMAEQNSKRKFKCSHCEYTSCRNSDLVRHEMCKHTGEKPFICDQCGRGFATSTILKNHLSTHNKSSGRSFKCDVCLKGFPSITRLKQHEKIHNDWWQNKIDDIIS